MMKPTGNDTPGYGRVIPYAVLQNAVRNPQHVRHPGYIDRRCSPGQIIARSVANWSFCSNADVVRVRQPRDRHTTTARDHDADIAGKIEIIHRAVPVTVVHARA